MNYFDTHAHLNDPAFDADRETLIPALVRGGLSLCLDVACEVKDFDRSRELIHKYPTLYGVCGVHPHYASAPGEDWEKRLRAALEDEKVVALGEIGLDYHYDFSEKEDQKRLFAYQLEMACALRLPVVLHIREAFGDCMDILRAHRNNIREDIGGVMHCFSGAPEIARECLDLGLHIAFGGSITFKNARRLLEAAAYVPEERLLVETDCPYLAPVPHRGERNTPANVPLVIEKLAAIRGAEPERIASATLRNGKRLFGIS